MCCTQPVFLQACRWYLFGVQVCEQKHGLVRSPNTRKNKRPKQPCNHIYIYTHTYNYIHITYPQISWSCSQISPLPQGLRHRDGALVLRAQRQGRSRSWRGRSLVPTNPLGCHLALNWAWWFATCLEKMAVSIGKILITIKSGGKPFSDKPIWCYEHLFKKYKHVWTMIYRDIGSKMESHETIESQQVQDM